MANPAINLNGNKIILSDNYKVNETSDDHFLISILILTTAVATSTDVFVDEGEIVSKVHGSISNLDIGIHKDLKNKTLYVNAAISATNETPLPSDCIIEISLDNGKWEYTIQDLIKFDEVGKTVELDMEIFFF